jgi:hemerythrin
MALFTWSDSYSIQVPQIDNEHRHLFILVDQLYEAMKEGSSRSIVESTLAELIVYCGEHFQHEEEVMRKSGYPELRSHRVLHEEFTAQILKFHKEFEAGRIALSLEILYFLKDWLVQHICRCDRRIATHLKNHAEPAFLAECQG